MGKYIQVSSYWDNHHEIDILLINFRSCPDCAILTLGTYDKSPTYTSNSAKVRKNRPLSCWIYCEKHKNIICILYNFFTLNWCRKLESLFISCMVNSLWPTGSDAIWHHRPGSTSAQVMACCLTAPSHHLSQCWLIISKVQWDSPEGNFRRDTSAINQWN